MLLKNARHRRPRGKPHQNLAFFGTNCPEGSCTAVVSRVGDHTLMGQIAGLAMHTGADSTPINKEIHHFIMVSGVTGNIMLARHGNDEGFPFCMDCRASSGRGIDGTPTALAS